MKKIKSLISIYSLFFIWNSYSQNYIPMLTNDATWSVSIGNPPPFFYNTIFTYSGDVTLGGQIYKHYINTSGPFEYYMREDVIAKKVYRYSLSAETLMFDFSLSDGDVNSNGILHITNINVNGGTRRKFQYYNSNGVPINNAPVYAEGIGGLGNPFIAGGMSFGGIAFSLNCSFQNNNMIYNRGLANSGTLTACPQPLGIDSEIFLNKNIVLSPNPFKSELHINSSIYLEKVNIYIYNLLGQIIKEIKNIDGEKIVVNRDNLANGIYIIKLFQNDILILTEKVIAE